MKKLVPVIVPGTEKVLMEAILSDGRGNNDFCIERDDNGLWHLFSITWYRAPNETVFRKWLSHATAVNFFGPWKREPYILLSPTNNWAPHIVRSKLDPSKKLMFLGGMGIDTLRAYEADATNLFDWKLHKDFGQVYGSRDPMLLYVEEEELYYMYTTFTTESNGNVGVAVSTSKELEEWSLVNLIPALPGWGVECVDESPFVVKKEGYYYLFTTLSSRDYYKGIPTRVFRSEYPDFRDIKSTAHENCITSLPVHAVEIVEVDGKTYLCQTGTGGPGIVANELRWGEEGEQIEIRPNELAFNGVWNNDLTDWYSCRKGDSYTCRFTGKRVEIRGSKRLNAGIAEVFIDGVSCGTFNQHAINAEYFDETLWHAFLWTSDDLEYGEHELKVVVTGEKSDLSENCYINVNRIVVIQ